MHRSRGTTLVAVPSRLAGPALAVSLGVISGCVGEPFIYGEDALEIAGGDAGLRSAATDGAPDGDAVAELGGDPIDVTVAVGEPSRPASDPGLPVATVGVDPGEAPIPSSSTSAVASTTEVPPASEMPTAPTPAEATPSPSATPSAVTPDPTTPPDDTESGAPPSGDPATDDPAPCPDCPRQACGNGIVESGENCDDGNTADGDGCSADCVAEACGDGFITPNEQCDDGNVFAGDGCGLTCKDEVCGDGVVQSSVEQCDDGNQVDSDLCRNGCTHPASLNSLSSSCAFVDQITQTVCMVATANWCRQFGHDPIAGLVTGITGDNEYTVGCIVGFERQDVSTSKLDQCPGGRQQSPSCLEQVNAACNELGYDRGFYLGLGSAANTYALACDQGTLTTASVPGCDGIADTSPTPITCSQALSERCGVGKGGIIQARAEWNQVTYTCVDLSLTGNARQF